MSITQPSHPVAFDPFGLSVLLPASLSFFSGFNLLQLDVTVVETLGPVNVSLNSSQFLKGKKEKNVLLNFSCDIDIAVKILRKKNVS